MRFESYGPAQIGRWSWEIEQGMRAAARAHLMGKYKVGHYRDPEITNAIIQHQFSFFSTRLSALIPKIATRDALEFVLTQYEQATLILHGQGISDPVKKRRWLNTEGNFRRAMKYLAELISIQAAKEIRKAPRRDAFRAMDQALLCAEMMVDMAEMSHRIFSVFPEHSYVDIHPPGGTVDWEVHVDGRFAGYDVELMSRLERDRQHRSSFIVGHQFDIAVETHALVLNPVFEACYGWSYARFIGGIGRIIENCHPAPNYFPTLFINRSKLIEQFTNNGEPQTVVEKMLAGFTVYPDRMEEEGRAVWNPKQENRAYRRGFFEFPDDTGLHLAFSREMARESLIHLINGVCYKRLPVDWHHPDIDKVLEVLSRQSGLWFEDVVAKNLSKLGISGGRAKGRVGNSVNAVQIPEQVGEIDFIGYSQTDRLLVIAEAKMVYSGIEAKFWRDDVSTFVGRKGSYAEKFRRKIEWVKSQRTAIAATLGISTDLQVAPVMVTLYPCIAKSFIDDFPCVSLAELMLDYGQMKAWPYATAS